MPVVVLGLLFWPLLAAGQTLRLYTEHFPPYNFVYQGQVVGTNTDIVLRACAIAKLDCTVSLYPWRRAFEMTLADKQSGLYTTAMTPQRRSQFQWVGPLASSRSFLYRLKRRPEVNPGSIEQAKSFGPGVAAGDIYEDYFIQLGFVRGKNLLDFPTKSAPIALFLQGKVDLVVGSDQVMPTWLAAHGASMQDVKQVFELNLPGNNYLALNKAVPAGQVQALQQAIDALRASGEYQQLVEKIQPSWK